MSSQRDPRDAEHADSRLHNMGGESGPASIRGSSVSPGRPRDEAAPKGGYSEPAGYVTGRDDEWPATAGSDEKAVAARTDEIEDRRETSGLSPHPLPPSGEQDPRAALVLQVRGPMDEALHGVIDEEAEAEPDADDSEEVATTAGMPQGGGHVSADLEWVPSDEDDPDSGSGRTEADDGGYLPGEGTGRPVDR